MKIKFAKVGNRCRFFFRVFRFADGRFRSAFVSSCGLMIGLLQ